MSNTPGKKAELDKDGISLDLNKAELDKEGIPLTEAPQSRGPRKTDDPGEQGETPANKLPPKRIRPLTLSLIGGIAAVCLVAGALLVLPRGENEQEAVPDLVRQSVTPAPVLSERDVLLDPFMVLFDPRNPDETGVLLAQVSLQVTPGTAPNIVGRLFDVRGLVYRRLSANARIYGKTEIAAMILNDLKDLQVKDVAFVQYETR